MYDSKDELLKAVYKELEEKTDMTGLSENDFMDVVRYALRDYCVLPSALILK